MNARHVARELVVLTLSQMSIVQAKDLENIAIEDYIEQAVRLLTAEADDCLKTARGELIKADDKIMEASLRDDPQKLREIITDSIEATHRAMELTSYCRDWSLLCTLAHKEDVRKFVVKLFQYYRENKKEIDQIIRKSIVEWTLESMYSVDKNIIRLAITEMLCESTSPKIAIDEAVEIAKKYSSEDSGSFVNGVLTRVIKTMGLEESIN